MNPPNSTLPAPDPEKLRRLAALVARVEGGEAAAEDELVAQLSPGLKVILRRLTGDAAFAEDVHQETLVVVLRRIRARELRQPEALAGFVRSTARNLVVAGKRKEARYADLGEEGEAVIERLQAEGKGDAAATAGAGAERSQLERLVAEEEASLVRQLLGELRHERDRELLVRVYLREEEKEAVCRDLDFDPALYNRLLFRARQRLRELWERSEKRQKIFGPPGTQQSRDNGGAGRTSFLEGGRSE
jgi:RNA polymerase sigma-70 factor (ECF subfamily)